MKTISHGASVLIKGYFLGGGFGEYTYPLELSKINDYKKLTDFCTMSRAEISITKITTEYETKKSTFS